MTIIMRHYDRQFDANFLRHLSKPAIYKLMFENGTAAHWTALHGSIKPALALTGDILDK